MAREEQDADFGKQAESLRRAARGRVAGKRRDEHARGEEETV